MSPPTRRTAPSGRSESGPGSFRGDTSEYGSGPRIGGRVVIDACIRERDPQGRLRPDTLGKLDDDVERRLREAIFAPAGSEVVIIVNPRQSVSVRGINLLREQAHHVGSITIESSHPETIGVWLKCLRYGWSSDAP